MYVFLKNSISNSACRDTKRSFPISLRADAYLLAVLSVKLKVGVSDWFLCHDAFSLVVCATCFSPLSPSHAVGGRNLPDLLRRHSLLRNPVAGCLSPRFYTNTQAETCK